MALNLLKLTVTEENTLQGNFQMTNVFSVYLEIINLQKSTVQGNTI